MWSLDQAVQEQLYKTGQCWITLPFYVRILSWCFQALDKQSFVLFYFILIYLIYFYGEMRKKKRFGNKPLASGAGGGMVERRSSTLSIYPHFLSNALEEGILMDKVHRTLSSEANCTTSLVYLIYLIISSALFSHAKKLRQWPFIICFFLQTFFSHFFIVSLLPFMAICLDTGTRSLATCLLCGLWKPHPSSTHSEKLLRNPQLLT